jgi:ABC-type ATPase with predicted acetyltransferase domain
VIEFDAWAAGLISRVAAVSELWPHELKTDQELRARIAHRLADSDQVVVADARAWRAHLDDLESLIVLAQRAREETRLRREPGSRPRPSGAS